MDNASKFKYIFFGTPDVARDTLAGLLKAGIKPKLVVSNPDAPRGRKQVITSSETKVLAEENNLPVFTPDTLDIAAIEQIKSYGADLAIVVAYGKILPQELLDIFPKGVLNVHYSLLPQYRGATPVESALLNDDEVTGVTVQKMVYKLDAGDIVDQQFLEITDEDTTATLRKKLVDIGTEMLVDILPEYIEGNIEPQPQDEAGVSHTHKLTKADGELDLLAPARENWNKYRAYVVWPGTFFFKDGKRVKITAAHWDKENGFVIDKVIPEGKKETEWTN